MELVYLRSNGSMQSVGLVNAHKQKRMTTTVFLAPE